MQNQTSRSLYDTLNVSVSLEVDDFDVVCCFLARAMSN